MKLLYLGEDIWKNESGETLNQLHAQFSAFLYHGMLLSRFFFFGCRLIRCLE